MTSISATSTAISRPPFARSLMYLLSNFPLGILTAVTVVTLTTVGLGTAIIWVGVPLLALAILGIRGAGRLERARIAVFLDNTISPPTSSLPEGGQKVRWVARLKDTYTWRSTAYFLLLLPLGTVQFTVLVACWSAGLALTTLPIYYRFLPDGVYYFPTDTDPWITVSSTMEALPWAAFGVLVVAFSIAVTKALAVQHVKFARLILEQRRDQPVLLPYTDEPSQSSHDTIAKVAG